MAKSIEAGLERCADYISERILDENLRAWAKDLREAAAEIRRFRWALEGIAELEGHTLLCDPGEPLAVRKAHERGANSAFNKTAEAAKSALSGASAQGPKEQ